jgi:hypothetical protein
MDTGPRNNIICPAAIESADNFNVRTAEGRAESKIAAILAVLAARGIAVTGQARARIEACKDLVTLDRWVARAATAASAEDVFASPT